MAVRIGNTKLRLTIAMICFIVLHLATPSARAESVLPSIAQVQESLKKSGYEISAIDGVFGPQTSAAIREFQKKSGLRVTGSLNEDISTALKLSGDKTILSVQQVQKVLMSEGYSIKVADGIFGPNTSKALKTYQEKHGLEPTGFINLRLTDILKVPFQTTLPQLTSKSNNVIKKPKPPEQLQEKKLLSSIVVRSLNKQDRLPGQKREITVKSKTPVQKTGPDNVVVPDMTPQSNNKKEPDTWIIATIIGFILALCTIFVWLLLKITRWLLRNVFYRTHDKPVMVNAKYKNAKAIAKSQQENPAEAFTSTPHSQSSRTNIPHDSDHTPSDIGVFQKPNASPNDLTTVHIDLSPQRVQRTPEPLSGAQTTKPDNGFSRSRFSPFKKQEANCWLPKGVPTKIAGITISRGMLYVGTKLTTQQRYGGPDNCLINPKLKVVGNREWGGDDYMPYWPSYSDISPVHRRQYLEWLASGASDPDAYIGYVFLYFYGLERRLFLDQSAEDQDDIIGEIKRLFSVYGDNRSVSRYLAEALSFVDIMTGKLNAPNPASVTGEHHWELPLNIKIYLGSKLKDNPILSVDDLMLWFLHHPERRLRTPARRLEKEFLALLRIKLTHVFPDGLKLKTPKKNIAATYTASSNTFKVDLSSLIGDIPDVSGFRAPINKLQNIADLAMDELDKLSRLLGRSPDEKGSVRAASLLPVELVKNFGGEKINELQNEILAQVQANSGIMPLSEIMTKLNTDHQKRVTKTTYKELSKLMISLEWNMVPAVNELIGTPKPNMNVLLLPVGNGGVAIEQPSNGFLLAIFELALGAHIAHADSNILEEEIEHLSQRVQNMHYLGRAERSRLDCYVQWLAHQDIDAGALKRKLRSLDQNSRSVFANFAVAVAVADGVIAPQEVKALESIYKAMDLNKKELFSSLHALAGHIAPSKNASSGTPSPVPKSNPNYNRPFTIDAVRVEQIRHETAKASNLLAAIFDEDEKEQPEEPVLSVEQNAEENLFDGLDGVHNQLLQELLSKTHWLRDEFDQLAASLKLLPDGAMETINEWAFETYDDAIIDDDDDQIVIDGKLLPGG